MSDDEWERWKAVYARQARPIPNVLERARTDRARARGGMVFIYLLALALCATDAGHLRHARTAVEVASAWFDIGSLALLVVGAQLAMRGAIGDRSADPLALLAGLERRHAARRRLLRFMPWGTGVIVAGALGSSAASMIAGRSFEVGSASGTVVVCVLTIWLIRTVMRRTGKLIDRELAEAAEVRLLMTDEER